MRKWMSRKLFALVGSIAGAYLANKGLSPEAADKIVELIGRLSVVYIGGQSFVDAGGLGGLKELFKKE